MTHKWMKYLLMGAAASLVLFWVLPASNVNGLMVLTLPFTLAADGLRALSLSGTVGNIAALVLYLLVGLSPLLLGLRRKWQKEDWLLPLACAALLYCLYYLINPGLRPMILVDDVGTLIYVGAVCSLLLSWWVVKLMRYCDSVGVSRIYQALRIFLLICAAECIFMGFGVSFGNFRAGIAAVQESNTMPGLNLMPTYIFQFLAFAVTALEYGLDAFVMLQGVNLLTALENDPYSEESANASVAVADWCRRSMVIIMLSYTLLNLGQLLCAGLLHDIAAQFLLPVMSLAIVFAMLALTRLLSQGRKLKEDNDLFI